jgi:Flp pilus assembly protein TadD
VLDFAGRHDDAVIQLRHAIELDSGYVQAHWRLADALWHAGRLREAIAEANHVVEIGGRSASAIGLLAIVYAQAGEPNRARPILGELLSRSQREYVPASTIADVYVALGNTDAAMTWFEKAFTERSNAIAYLVANPETARLRGDPRYEAILARVGLR